MLCCRDLAASTGRGAPWIWKAMQADREVASFGLRPIRRRKRRSGVDRSGDRGRVASNIVLANRSGDSAFANMRIALDSQNIESPDSSHALWIGPLPGDIAEIEAYCRIFRAAELLHAAVMKTVCNPETGECVVSYDFPSEDLPLLEEKVVSMLGCMLALVDRGRDEVLHGRSSLVHSFRLSEPGLLDGRCPPLVAFRSEMKRCCESLYVALSRYLTLHDDRSLKIWQKLQRLRNVTYDVGLPHSEGHPCPTMIANWTPVCISIKKDGMLVEDSEVAFWKGGQLANEGLQWLIEKGFKTIVDLRGEVHKDEYYKAAIEHAVSHKMIEVINLPVEPETPPSREQVKQFAMLVSDPYKKPLYLHSQEGLNRTSAMVSRWRQHITHVVKTNPSNQTFTFNNNLSWKSEDHTHVTIQSSGSLVPQDVIPVDESALLTEPITKSDVETSNCVQSDGIVTNGDLPLSDGHQIEEVPGCADERVDQQYFLSFSGKTDPLRAQFPSGNIFSHKDMKQFFGGTKVSPKKFIPFNGKKFEAWSVPVEQKFTGDANEKAMIHLQSSEVIHSAQPVGPYTTSDVPSKVKDDGKYSIYSAPMPQCLSDLSKDGKQEPVEPLALGTRNGLNNIVNAMPTFPDKKYEKSYNISTKLEANMCSSATGVVRLQSRKKAEMFLVRTDGVSCTRENVTESSLAFSHPSTQQQLLLWKSSPKTVLLLKKLGEELIEEAKEVAAFLYYQENMNVIVEPDVHDAFDSVPGFGFVQTFQDISDLQERVDFVACLGGDGVILHGSNLFRGAVPPMVSFNLGSLGFLTSHSFEDYRHALRAIIHGNTGGVYITLRMRLHCQVLRNGKKMQGKVFDVLNEVVVDRGSSPYISKIECYEHNHLITKVQGDGVIIATPTGSTAYSTAAGGSMVHPNVPCMLFTPICPHSLSFRPAILPDSAELELKIPDDARSNAWVSFDGKRRQQLSRGDSVNISMSQHPLPTVNKSDQTGDWFHSLISCLNWNDRLDQKAL